MYAEAGHPPPLSAAVSDSFHPLCKVLITVRSVYLFTIGPMPEYSGFREIQLATLHSNCTHKQLYSPGNSWVRADVFLMDTSLVLQVYACFVNETTLTRLGKIEPVFQIVSMHLHPHRVHHVLSGHSQT